MTLRFAVVTDTHANPDKPVRLERLERIFRSIERAEPDFVLNCGDITDRGDRAEYDAYLATVPASLRDRVRHVPGNHEVRWDTNAAQLYRSLFGPAPYSFDATGLHVTGLDPTQLLQEPGHFGERQLAWLADDLRSAAPSVLFLHYPLGADHYHVDDQDAFFTAVADLPVRAVFAGHVHREGVYRINGFTQVTAVAAKNVAAYYWVERQVDSGHPVLRVTTVALAADGTEVREELTTIALSGNDSDRLLEPGAVVIDGPRGGSVRVGAEFDGDVPVAGVEAQVYPQHVYAGRSRGNWTELDVAGRSRVFTGDIDVSALPAGRHRMQVRVVGSDGATWEAARAFEVPATQLRERWTARLSGSVQGALAEWDATVVAGSTDGEVAAFDAASGQMSWRRGLGPVYRGSACAGSTVYVPSTDHHLYALDAATGHGRWSVDVSAPVLCTPLVTEAAGTEAVVFTAGHVLHVVSATDGTQLWSADLGGFSAGRAACDGQRVYVGSGDGCAYAFDAGSGERLWSSDTTTRVLPHGRLLYGPWNYRVELLPGGTVLFATVERTFAVDRASGDVCWEIAARCMYPPSRLTGHGVLLADEYGMLVLVDPATGRTVWTVELGAPTLDAGPVVAADTAWVVSATGLLSGVDLATGGIRHRRQVCSAGTFSTPVVADGVLVLGDQDGLLHGIELP